MPTPRKTRESLTSTYPDRSSARKRKRNIDDDEVALPDRITLKNPPAKSKAIVVSKEKRVGEVISAEASTERQAKAIESGEAHIVVISPAKVKKDSELEHTEDTDSLIKEAAKKKSKVKRGKKVIEPAEESDANSDAVGDEEEKPKKRKRKTKEERDAEGMPLVPRTKGLNMFVGAHCSIAKGVENAVINCVHIGGNAFALFLKSQRKWDNPALKDENRDAFTNMCLEHKYDASSHVLPHGSYLVNLAQEDKEKAKQGYSAFLDDLHRCEALGIKYYNFHPGAASNAPLAEAISRVSSQLNRALAETKTVVPVLENMCGSGSILGSRFTDLRDILAGIKPEFKSRVGVCIDTCHAFAAGHDLRSPHTFKAVLEEFDKVVGFKYLKALHLNDSKAPFDSKRDLHQNIGLGFLGLRAFHNVMNEPRFQNMPLILETPCDRPDPDDPTGKKLVDDKSVWAREIKLLESLIGMDPEGADFKKLEKELGDQGKAERAKMQKAFEEKNAKARKKVDKEREKGQKSLRDMMGGGGKKGKGKLEPPDTSDQEELD